MGTGNLGLLQRLRLRLTGSVPIGYRFKSGWKAPIMHYAVRCDICGEVFEDYPRGYNERFDCPECRKPYSLTPTPERSLEASE